MTPEILANLIMLVANDAIEGRISIDSNSKLNQALWNLAHQLNIQNDVDRILQGTILEEMMEVLKGTNP